MAGHHTALAVNRKPSRARTSKRRNSARPTKPYDGYPMYPHPLGYWSKKIRGKIFSFGRWGRVVNGKLAHLPYEEGWQAALAEYERQRDALHAGRIPSPRSDGLQVKDLCNRFLTVKQHLLTTGEITGRTFQDYRGTTDRIVRVLGKDRPLAELTAEDFGTLRADMAKTLGPISIGNEIQRCRTIFKLAYDNALIDKPMRYGQGFNKPSRKVLRKAKAANGVRLFEPHEIRSLLGAANPTLRAMILLGINCGFGNADCGTMPLRAINLDTGWVDYPRPKTGIPRRCPLWPETVAALHAAIDERPTPKDKAHNQLVFITKYGRPWAKDVPDSPVSKEMAKLLDELGLRRPGLGFYTLRHVFRTLADATRDFPAIDLIMGHADHSMASHYRERIDDDRLQAVTEHVRRVLFYGPWVPIDGNR